MLDAKKSKAEALAEKMNKLTEKFAEHVDFSDEMIVEGDELESTVTDLLSKNYKTDPRDSSNFNTKLVSKQDAINLEMLLEDFKYVRNILRSNADDGRKILSSITMDIMAADPDDNNKAILITSFADLNKSIAINMDLYLKTYKEISNILVQLDKITEKTVPHAKKDPKVIGEIDTTDIIKKLNKIEIEDVDLNDG